MGKKKFLTKENATKYDLIFRSGEAVPQRDWVESSRKVGIGRPDAQQLAQDVHLEQKGRYPEAHPLSWLERAEEDVITDERRQEIIALGFPDDGYDYLKHLRRGQSSATVGAKGESIEGESAVQESYSGPSVYISAPNFEAPPQDYKALDASRLTVHQAATHEDDATLIAGGTSAFTRELGTFRKQLQHEIDEMEKLMRQFEDLDDKEKGDLLEDFVLTATEVSEEGEPPPTQPQPSLPLFEARAQTASSNGSDSEEGSEDSSTEAYHPKAPRSETKSLASTYWRPERNDRKANLSVIDERFEQLALEYNSDDIGDDAHEDPSDRGVATTDQFAKVMDDFLTSHATQDHAHEGGQEYLPPSAACAKGVTGEEATVAAEALAKTKRHLLSMEEQDAGDGGGRDEDGDLLLPEEEPRERWDCESVLTTRSTLYNHPAKLDVGWNPALHRRRDHVKLSSKTGLPVLRSVGWEGDSSPADSQAESSTRRLALQRQPDETPAEKRERKGVIKEAKRQARASKKELKTMYKEGIQKQKLMATPAVSTVRMS